MKKDKKEKDNEGKLIIDELSENAHRVRRNLLIFSFVAIFYKFSGASIGENGVSFYGINFNHVDESFISIGIFSIVFYHFFHFLLIAIAHWQYLRIRVTRYNGGVVAPGTTASGRPDDPDYPANPKDSSLYYWFCRFASIQNEIFIKIKEDAEKLSKENPINIKESDAEKISQENQNINKKLNDVQNRISGLNELLKCKRLIRSLTKFDNYLRCYRCVELSRWIFIEIALPLLAGVMALFMLLSVYSFTNNYKTCFFIIF